MRTTLILAGLLLVSQAGFTQSRQAYSAQDTSFVGWIKFAQGEFQLYADQDQIRRPFARPCVSGSADRDEMRQAVQDLNNQKVRIIGRTQAWSDDLPGDALEFEGATIRNDCDGEFVILADDILPIA